MYSLSLPMMMMMKRFATVLSLLLASTVDAAPLYVSADLPVTQIDTSACHSVGRYQECELPLKNARGEIAAPPRTLEAPDTAAPPLGLHPLQSVRLMFDSSSSAFTRLVVVLHGCNPSSGWSKITTDQFVGLKPGTLYVIPFANTAYGSCSEGLIEYFRRVPVENLVSQLSGMILLSSTNPSTLSDLPLTVAAHSAGQKAVVHVAALSSCVDRFLLLDAAYTQGYFTREFDVLFAQFMTAQGGHSICAFDTADVDGLPGQSPKYGCQQYCTSATPCLGTWSTSAGHMGVLFQGLGALTQ